MTAAFTVVIPARYGSSRFPGKPLKTIAGKPMVQLVWEQACKSSAERVVIATDDARIVEACQAFGAEVLLTRDDHNSGTDRLAEVAAQLGLAADAIVVNVQGDEPMIPPAVIDQVASNLAAHPEAGMSTLAEPIDDVAALFNPNIVKVATDRHIGIYAYRAGFLHDFVSWGPCWLENTESLEQLRALWNGVRIHVADALEAPPGGVDTPEDLERVRRLLEG
ncbi:3-deoxy-manno-octulosonate cytidylyltransferase [Pseudomonas syringae]|uniref:3-deoxy-manno-octulosonate cytidylyltransferase n=1 Tax=Pseudomonas syringae TaxID=317 RepID=UPI00200B4357|nr:3-deoxy-manno-octulosonate cytidylyltransferase [Pseudomonas syringae]MCK9775147.1 3-deoxy-manno-octulosonate cytidylyltransferase [Pseudomonas syringae pv. syringae]